MLLLAGKYRCRQRPRRDLCHVFQPLLLYQRRDLRRLQQPRLKPGGLQGHANGNRDGEEFTTFVSGGYDFHFGHLTIRPIASLQYTNVYVDFREKGSLAPLSMHSDSEESLRSDVG